MPDDPRQIFNTARSFSLAADRAFEQRPLAQGQFQVLMVPAVVCQAFAIELYFKAIITLEGGSADCRQQVGAKPRSSGGQQRKGNRGEPGASGTPSRVTGHDLACLYSKILPNTQAALLAGASLSEGRLNQELAKISTAFVDWRYIFESQSAHMDLGFLHSIIDAARTEAESLLMKAASDG